MSEQANHILANKRLAKNTLFLYIRQFFVLVLGLYTSRLTLQVLGETDFGVYATVGGMTSLLTILTTSLSAGTQRFITFSLGKGDLKKLNKVYITSVNIHILLSFILIVVGELFGTWFVFEKMTIPDNRIWTAYYVFQITLFNSVLHLINIPNNAEIVAHEDMGSFAVVTIFDAILKFLSVLLLFYISYDKLLAYAIALFFIQFLQRMVCSWYCKRKYPEVKYNFLIDKTLMKSMIKIAGWMSLSNLSVTGFVQGVNILINVFFGPAMNAAYAVAMQAYSGLRSFCSSFQLASNPQLVKLYATGEIEKMQKLLCSVCKLSFFLVFIISLPFLINSEYFLRLWLGNVPEYASEFLALLLVYAYIDVLAYPIDISVQATGYVKCFCISISIGVLMILPIAYGCYLFGAVPETVYIIAIFISWILLVVRVYFLKKLIHLSPTIFMKNVVLKIGLVFFVSLVIPVLYSIYFEDDFLNVLFNTIICITLTPFIIYSLGLDKKEKEFIKSSFISLKLKVFR